MSMIPERHRDDPEDEPPDPRADDRRAARHEPPPTLTGPVPVTPADFTPRRLPD